MEQLASFMKQTGWSQSRLSQEAGISKSYLSEIMSGAKRPSIDVALQIAEATGGKVKVSDILPEMARVFLKAAS